MDQSTKCKESYPVKRVNFSRIVTLNHILTVFAFLEFVKTTGTISF